MIAGRLWAGAAGRGFGSIWDVPTTRDMLNIVLGATLGLNMAVVHFFGDYLHFLVVPLGGAFFSDSWFRGCAFNANERHWLSGGCAGGHRFFFYFRLASSRLVL